MTARRRYWTPAEVEQLRRRYADEPTDAIAQALGRQLRHVHAKAVTLGLKKTHEAKSAASRKAMADPGHGGRRSQFQPGQVPWNTGTKGKAGQHENSRATQFKPGARPVTWVPVGSYRIDPDGCLQVKYSDEPGSPTRRWMGVHRAVWEAAHGPVPAGHVVVFKPGRFTTQLEEITLDAVELVSRAELMGRNSIHQMHPQLAEVSRLRGTLKRAINQRAKVTEAA